MATCIFIFLPRQDLDKNALEGVLAMLDYGGHLLYTFMRDQKKLPENQMWSHYAFAILSLSDYTDNGIFDLLPMKEDAYRIYESNSGNKEIDVFCVTENLVNYLLKDREKTERNPLLKELYRINRMDKGELGLSFYFSHFNMRHAFSETCFFVFRSQEYAYFGMSFQLTGARKRSRSFVNNILTKSGTQQIIWRDYKINNRLFSTLIILIEIPKELM
jgi:hypothetical protein